MRRAAVLLLLLASACASPDPAPRGAGAPLARPAIPELQFGDPADARAATVTRGEHFYAVSLRRGEVTLSIHATDVVHPAPPGANVPPPPPDHIRGVPARILVNEGIRSITWDDAGVSYVLEVECYRPFEDQRCTEDAFIRATAESLVMVEPQS
jgi:hypothetical protein